MPLVQTFMYAGAYSVAQGLNCLATGVTPACLTAVQWIPTTGTSLPIMLVSRTGALPSASGGTPSADDNTVCYSNGTFPCCNLLLRSSN